eukprot:11187087-Prorocentrum_lima.AAC.1
MADRHYVCPCAPLSAQPDAAFPSSVQAALRFCRPHPIVHQLSKFISVFPAWLAEKSLVGGTAVMAHRVL